MARRSLRVCLAVVVLGVSCGTRAAPGPALRAGDLVFETSSSRQSAAIQWATASRWSHVGIVDVGPDGDVAVIEALGKVSRTPWTAWRKRARRGGAVLVLRPFGLSDAQRGAAVEEAKKLLGRPYDARFGWDDEKIYCSELVVKAYERGAGISYGRRQRLGDLRLLGVEAAAEKRWGGPIRKDLVLVTPASLVEDTRLARVYEGR
jgi:hypothetical protein